MAGFSPVGSPPVAAIGGGDGNYYPTAGGIVFRGSNVAANQAFPAPGKMTFLGALPAAVLAAPRVTWFGAEVAHAGAASARTSWMGIEVLGTVATIPTLTIVSWIGVEALHVGAAAWRASWIGAEVAHTGAAASRVSWIGAEVLRSVADRRGDTGWVCLIAA